MNRALTILFIVLLVCLLIGLPNTPVLKISISKTGKGDINLNLKNIADPFCLVSLEFAKDKSFKNFTKSFVIGPANFSRALIEFKVPGTPVDSNNQLISNLYSRLAVDCSGAESAGSSSSKIYSVVQTLDLSKLSDRYTVPEDKFLSSLVGKTLTSALRKSRSKFSNSLKAFAESNQLPVITSQLSDKTFSKDQDIIFRLGAEGSKPVRFDWLFSASADGQYSKLTQKKLGLEIISDSRGSTLIIRSGLIDLTEFYTGFIKVKAYNRYGTVESAAAQILSSSGIAPTVIPTIALPAATMTKTAAPTKTPVPSNTAVPTNIPTKVPTATKTPESTNTKMPTISVTVTATTTRTANPTATATKIPTFMATQTATSTPALIEGVCGTASGQTFSSVPVANLCSSGTASSVSKSGSNYNWSCLGINGGKSELCSAIYQTVVAREPNPKCKTRPLLEDGRPWCDNTGPSHRSRIVHQFNSPVLVEVTVNGKKELRVKEGSQGAQQQSAAISFDPVRNIAVFENFHAKGKLSIEARNVLVRNFIVENGGIGTMDISPSDTTQNIFIEDGEVFGSPAANMGGSNYVAKRLNIHHGSQDFSNASSNITVEDSFFHNGGFVASAHTDAIQYGANRIGHNVTYRRNYFYMPFRSDNPDNPPPAGTEWPSNAELKDPTSPHYAPHLVQIVNGSEYGIKDSQSNSILFLENAANLKNFLMESNWIHGSNKGMNLSTAYNFVKVIGNKFECVEDWENARGIGMTANFPEGGATGNVFLNPYTNQTIAIPSNGGDRLSNIYCSRWPK